MIARLWPVQMPVPSLDNGVAVTRKRRLLLVLACVVFLMHAALHAAWIVDDAYVSFRYARNLVNGHGLVFNHGDRVEGYTNFSWTILSAVAIALGLEPELVMPAIGLASAIGLLFLVAHEGKRLAEADGRPHPLAGVPAAFAMACSTGLAIYAMCGLETAFFALLLTAAVTSLVSGRLRRFALLTALAILTRPEAGLVGMLGLTLIALQASRGEKSARRGFVEAVGILVLLVGPYLAFKLQYFGSLAPNTLAAKPPDLRAGLVYVGEGLGPLVGLIAAAIISAWKAIPQEAPLRWSRTSLLLSAWAILTLSVVLEGGDFMPGFRMLLPSVSMLALAADRSVLDLFRMPRRARDLAPAVVLLGVLFYPVIMARQTLLQSEQGSLLAQADVGRRQFVRELTQSGIRSLATFDVGLVGFLAPDVRVVDLGGLTDRTIARSPGYYWNKEPPVEYLREQAPDAFVFTSLLPPKVDPKRGVVSVPSHYVPEDTVKAMPWFAENYSYVGTAEVLEGSYYLHWFGRKGGPGTAAIHAP